MSAPAGQSATGTDAGFVRALSLTDATMLVAGSMIGSGVFITSADIARTTQSPAGVLLAWAVAGAITVLGALSFGELAAMYPRAGGQYVFLRESLGPLPGFLYGWTLFTVIQTGTIAAVAVAFARFMSVLVPGISEARFAWFPQHDFHTPGGVIALGLSPQRVVALLSLWSLTAINLRGVTEGKRVQTALTLLKTVALGLLVLAGLALGRSAPVLEANFAAGHFAGPHGALGPSTLAFGAALVGSLFSCDAWNNVTFAAAEVRDAPRNLPRALALGTGMVIGLYLLANLAYLCVLPLAGDPQGVTVLSRGISHASQDRVGVAVVQALFGDRAALAMAAALLVSTYGCNNGLVLAGARVYYAMARDGLFFKAAGALNARGVPARALVLQAVWASALCLTGTYGQLLDYVVFAALVFYVLTLAGLFVLRVREPDRERPYRAVGYPALPALYIAAAVVICAVLLLADKTRAQALSGLALVLLGVPVFALWRRKADTAT